MNMDFAYYIVRKRDMVIIDGAADMVGAVKMAQNQNCACIILQGCIITELGQDEMPTEHFEEPESMMDEFVQPEVIEDNIEEEII
jgi:hypothetical protein